MAGGRLRRSLRRAPDVLDDVVAWRLTLQLVAVLVVTGLVVGALPHALGTVGGDPIETNDEPVQQSIEDGQQRYQNAVTSTALGEGPWVLLFVALAGSFVAATRSREPTRGLVASASLGVAVGTVVGYVALVGLGHLAYAPTENGYLVRSGPVVLRTWTTAGNALGFAVPATIGSALVAASGTLAREHDGREPVDGGGFESDAEGSDDDGETSVDPDDSATENRPDAVTVDGTGPAGAPPYDPSERDWEGADGEDGEDSE